MSELTRSAIVDGIERTKCGSWFRGVAYKSSAQKMMMTRLNVKIFAMPSAKPRIIDSTPSLQFKP